MFPDEKDNKRIQWDITNYGSTTTITQIDISWPSVNGALGLINFGGSAIWAGLEEPPSTTISEFSGDPTINGGGTTKTLEFEFEADTGAAGQYSIIVTFDNGCTVSLSSTGTTIAWDDFESNGWDGGGGWLDAWDPAGRAHVTSAGGPHGGSYHLRLRGGVGTQQGYVERALNLSGRSNVYLQFYAKARNFGSGDTAKCLVHDGTGWYTVWTWANGDDDNQYHFYHLDLASYNMASEFWIAFDADMNQRNDRLFIDDVSVIEVGP